MMTKFPVGAFGLVTDTSFWFLWHCWCRCTTFATCLLLHGCLDQQSIYNKAVRFLTIVDGSGTGPFAAHFLCSYFALIHISILFSVGNLPFNSDSQYLQFHVVNIHASITTCNTYILARWLPHLTILSICSGIHVSRSTDFTTFLYLSCKK